MDRSRYQHRQARNALKPGDRQITESQVLNSCEIARKTNKTQGMIGHICIDLFKTLYKDT